MLRYLTKDLTLRLDPAACNGCGMCVVVYPHAVLEIHERRARVAARDRCMECGACAMNCPTGAVTVRAGVGCATGVILGSLGVQGDCCCAPEAHAAPAAGDPPAPPCG
jgi:ferredoxin